jgi:hypothetical protein
MKKKILVVVSLLIVVAMLTTGAYAYFTTLTRTAHGNIQSGTLDLKIAAVVPSADCPAANEIVATDVTLWDLTNLAPGQEITGKLCMINTGSIDIAQVGFNWTGMTGDLAEHLFVTKLENSRTGDEIGSYIATNDVNGDGKMSLAELGRWGGEDEYWVGGIPVFLPDDGIAQWVSYTFVFDPDAGNEFQGLNFDYLLTITGYQHPKY